MHFVWVGVELLTLHIDSLLPFIVVIPDSVSHGSDDDLPLPEHVSHELILLVVSEQVLYKVEGKVGTDYFIAVEGARDVHLRFIFLSSLEIRNGDNI